jgi:pimeloyl-ACP methyl ester carboxylesterase
MALDLRALGPRFELPFFVFQGERDILTPVAAARPYFDWIEAPRKEFVLIEGAGHLATWRPSPSRSDSLQRWRRACARWRSPSDRLSEGLAMRVSPLSQQLTPRDDPPRAV